MHELFLIRHGEYLEGLEDGGLSEEGIVNVRKLGDKIGYILGECAKTMREKVYTPESSQIPENYFKRRFHSSSESRRAIETSNIIADACLNNKSLSSSCIFNGTDESLYHRSSSNIIKMLDDFEKPFSIGIVVGHNPKIAEVAKYFKDKKDFQYEGAEEFLEWTPNAKGYRVSYLEKSVTYLD
ncbi:MAG: hypothetical protein OQK82_00845 [Candidatus Pacearchaeota archaeon]|nr:hypothetical protein [Candidatus Pacearchaeota archaeon]